VWLQSLLSLQWQLFDQYKSELQLYTGLRWADVLTFRLQDRFFFLKGIQQLNADSDQLLLFLFVEAIYCECS
jgi:hypothetical protein